MVEIYGYIFVLCVNSYDYVVEWVFGVQLFDGDYIEIVSENNVLFDVIIGLDDFFVVFDVCIIDVIYEVDFDSLYGEN